MNNQLPFLFYWRISPPVIGQLKDQPTAYQYLNHCSNLLVGMSWNLRSLTSIFNPLTFTVWRALRERTRLQLLGSSVTPLEWPRSRQSQNPRPCKGALRWQIFANGVSLNLTFTVSRGWEIAHTFNHTLITQPIFIPHLRTFVILITSHRTCSPKTECYCW